MESFPPVNTSIRSTIRTSSTDSTSSERIRRRRPCSGCAICFRSVRPFILQGIFLLLGIGLLIPWNAFISAKAYFESRICLEDGTFPPETTTSSSQISSFFALVFNLSSVISVTAMIAMESWKDYWITTTTATTTRTTSTLDANHDAQLVRSESATPRLTACLEIDPLNDSQTYPYGHALFNDSNNKTDNNSNTGGGNSFWLVTLPLSLYVFVFWSQSIMTLKVHTPSFLEWTTAGLVVCGMASGIAGAGIVASAGPFEARLAMNPFLTVRHQHSDSNTVCW